MTPKTPRPLSPSRQAPARLRCGARAAALAVACVGLAGQLGCNSVQSQTLNSEGVALYQQGAYQQAASKFQTAIAKTPDSADGYYNLAAALHKGGLAYNRPDDLRQAEVLYNQCLERDPNHVDCYRGLAVLLKDTERPDASFRLLNNWKIASPNNPAPNIELARLLEEANQPEQAKAQLVAALTADPNNARALTALGRLRDQAGDYQQAMQNYQRSLTLNRFQPQVAARVAALQTATGLSGVATGGADQTRLSQQWRPTATY
ncbi:cellulose synthase subunit BcsC [Pseudobythopirellula maris]|uniref:Cellulose synthase subunit BcsC n=1 Tax=Pseudobythopirellula maris TaxID=2527991 RepID=A0A5C5ZG14_9BACT|nr:tetratricopeptide repeat protein [Pseudobythopirellula maris]TWT86272.1 cellulose synthase subunit BcsC [Pseudobythopirellula maris]